MTDASEQRLTYREVGATAGTLPSGYHTIDVTRRIVQGREWFEIAAHRLSTWDMHRRAGIRIITERPDVVAGAEAVHPECGEERFLVNLGPDEVVSARIRAFSRPGRWFTHLGGPVARQIQAATTRRYLGALTTASEPGH